MANITKVYLLSVPLEDDYRDTLYFANATAQHTYFAGQVVKSYTDFSYQRKDGVIRVPAVVDSIRNCNYVMYQNSAYSNKWFYAFIERMVYVDDGRTDIYIATDVLQTWMFEMDFKDSFIEREHVNDDTIGIHTIPEGLDTGEYICNEVQKEIYCSRSYYDPQGLYPPTGKAIVCIQVTTLQLKDPNNSNTYEPTNPPTRNIANGIPQGLYTIGIPYNKDFLTAIYELVGAYDTSGRSEAIVSMFLCPSDVASSWTSLTGTGIWASGYYMKFNDSDTATTSKLVSVTMPTSFDGYVPHNNKCKVAPYNYFHVSNNAGSDVEFYYEDFLSNTGGFSINCSLEQGGAVALIPNTSKKTTGKVAGGNTVTSQGFPESILGGKLPQLSWASDYYLNWEANNGKNLVIQTGLAIAGWATNIIGGMVGGATGQFGNYDMTNLQIEQAQSNPRLQEKYIEQLQTMPGSGSASGVTGMIGSTLSMASQVASSANAIRQAKIVPPQAKGNSSAGSLQFATDNCAFTIYKMSCRAEYMKCVDSYFDMFGYKVNRLGKPLKNHRQNYWYTKTIGANIDGNIPNEDMEIIKAIYNKGVTYWKNPANIKDYSVSNNIVS